MKETVWEMLSVDVVDSESDGEVVAVRDQLIVLDGVAVDEVVAVPDTLSLAVEVNVSDNESLLEAV